jgi:hypothetical protein
MRPLLLSLPLLLMAPALAQALPDSLRMSCASTRALVQQQGSAVIATGPNIYELFVTEAGQCYSKRSEPAWIATADQEKCLVGQRCRDRRWQMKR